MSQKTYRRLTRFLFLFLFLVFLLLYLLLSRRYDRASANGGGYGWRNRNLALGDVKISDVRSGGFIVDEFPFGQSTSPAAEDFDRQVAVCRTHIVNEGEVAVNVGMSIHGTRLGEGDAPLYGLNCGAYTYAGEDDPAGADYAAFLTRTSALPPDGQRLTLWQEPDGGTMRIPAGESRSLVLFVWVDEAEVPTLTDLDRERYSVTVKLTSRAA